MTLNAFKHLLIIVIIMMLPACKYFTKSDKSQIKKQEQNVTLKKNTNKKSITPIIEKPLVDNKKEIKPKVIPTPKPTTTKVNQIEVENRIKKEQKPIPVVKITQPSKSPSLPQATIQKVKNHSIKGKVSLDSSSVRDDSAKNESIVIFFEADGYKNDNSTAQDFVITTQHKRFLPNVLAIPKGSTVKFPNEDTILHNVFSISHLQKFDLGLYGAGKEQAVTFYNPGIVYVHCNVHHSMQADILVLDTPWYTYADKDGNFEIKGITYSSGTLNIWHPRANIKKKNLELKLNDNEISETLLIKRARLPQHMNKLGQSYRAKKSNQKNN